LHPQPAEAGALRQRLCPAQFLPERYHTAAIGDVKKSFLAKIEA